MLPVVNTSNIRNTLPMFCTVITPKDPFVPCTTSFAIEVGLCSHDMFNGTKKEIFIVS